MSHFLENAKFYDYPVRLTKIQKEAPYSVFDDFFDNYTLSELRQSFWEIMESCLTADSILFSEPNQRSDLLLLYENIETFLEAAFIITEQKERDTAKKPSSCPENH